MILIIFVWNKKRNNIDLTTKVQKSKVDDEPSDLYIIKVPVSLDGCG